MVMAHVGSRCGDSSCVRDRDSDEGSSSLMKV